MRVMTGPARGIQSLAVATGRPTVAGFHDDASRTGATTPSALVCGVVDLKQTVRGVG
jgi:hypothetical protein